MRTILRGAAQQNWQEHTAHSVEGNPGSMEGPGHYAGLDPLLISFGTSGSYMEQKERQEARGSHCATSCLVQCNWQAPSSSVWRLSS